MLEYNNLLIDAQWLITRTAFSVNSRGELSEAAIIRQFFTSLNTAAKLYTPLKKLVLCWDTRPYIKSTGITEFKTDRVIYSEVDVEKAETDEERQRIQDQINLHKMKNNAKQSIISLLPLCSLHVLGYEADDIAYIINMHTNDPKYTNVFYTVDSDWKFLIRDNSMLCKVAGRGSGYEEFDFESVLQELPEPYDTLEENKLFLYKCLCDLLISNHNGIQIMDIPSRDEFFKLYLKNPKSAIETFTDAFDTKQFISRMRLLDPYTYPNVEELKSTYDSFKAGLNTDLLHERLSILGVNLTREYLNNFVNLFNYDTKTTI